MCGRRLTGVQKHRLRMNRDYMEFMREHYNHLTKDHFGKTIVNVEAIDDDDDE